MKKNNLFKKCGLLLLLTTVLFSCDDTMENMVNGVHGDGYYDDIYNLSIGDEGPGEGIVFYINPNADRDGWKYLEAATDDQNSGIAWSDIVDAFANGNAALPGGIGTGYTNSITIVNNSSSSAAEICREYRIAQEGDWFLPSKDELGALYNSGFVSLTSPAYYWSSTESDGTPTAALKLDANSGNIDGSTKSQTIDFYVRAIRAF